MFYQIIGEEKYIIFTATIFFKLRNRLQLNYKSKFILLIDLPLAPD